MDRPRRRPPHAPPLPAEAAPHLAQVPAKDLHSGPGPTSLLWPLGWHLTSPLLWPITSNLLRYPPAPHTQVEDNSIQMKKDLKTFLYHLRWLFFASVKGFSYYYFILLPQDWCWRGGGGDAWLGRVGLHLRENPYDGTEVSSLHCSLFIQWFTFKVWFQRGSSIVFHCILVGFQTHVVSHRNEMLQDMRVSKKAQSKLVSRTPWESNKAVLIKGLKEPLL